MDTLPILKQRRLISESELFPAGFDPLARTTVREPRPQPWHPPPPADIGPWEEGMSLFPSGWREEYAQLGELMIACVAEDEAD